MYCEKCKKNTATVCMQQLSDGVKKDIYLCNDCSGEVEMFLILENIFHGLFSKIHANSHAKTSTPQPTCDRCGLTLDGLKKDGTMGCAACYRSFFNILEPLLMNTHTAITHEGKFPKRAGASLKRDRQVYKLRTHMQQAVEEEDFGRAAFLRDQIRRLDAQQEYADNEGSDSN
ncbi:MAG: UvrB/UvrC motif-containing protein [Firmicutes bacterium]|nr:UvrB/UvrC motif-containing protein [Bacillota bacterium]